MNRIISMALCICLLLPLWGCNRDAPQETPLPGAATETEPTGTEPSLATLPNAAHALGEESVMVTPQVGAYTESTFLANIPGQGDVALLSVRSDGTVDYIFYTPEEKVGFYSTGIDTVAMTNSLTESGFRYYTVTPDGQAALQPSDWMARLDEVLAAGLEAVPEDAVWHLGFSANEGTIFIVCHLCSANEQFQTVLYRLKDNQLTQVPLQQTYELDGKSVAAGLSQLYQVFASGETFLMRAPEGNSARCIALTYSGEAVAAQVMEPDSLYYLRGVGNEIAWFASSDLSRLTAVATADLTWVSEYYPKETGYTFCSGTAPDGRCLYSLIGENGTAQKRLVRYSADGEEVLIDDPNVYAFGSPSCVCKAMTASNDGLVYLWSRENGQGALWQYRYNPEGAKEPETVTVYSLEDSQTVRTAVSLWNRTHSDVTFAYEIAAEEIDGTSLTMDDAITQLNTQLVNGEGPDVLILDGLPVDSILDKGFLHPLTGLDTTGVYGNLLERFTLDGGLYAVPARMTPYLLGRKIEGTEPIDSLESFADYIVSATERLDCSYMSSGGDWSKKALYYIDYADQIFDLWYPAWSEAIWADNSFHPEVYQELLTQTNRLVEHYSLETIDELIAVYGEDPKVGLTRENYTIVNSMDGGSYPYCLAANNYVGMTNFVPGPDFVGTWNLEPIPCEITGIPGPEGTGATVPTCIAAVREGGNTQAGVEFLQLLLSDEVQLDMGNTEWFSVYGCDGYPVKWSCTPALLEYLGTERQQDFDIENDFRAVLSNLNPVILYEVPYNAAKEAALRYYEGKLTAQEAADQVSDATAIYLAEQRR